MSVTPHGPWIAYACNSAPATITRKTSVQVKLREGDNWRVFSYAPDGLCRNVFAIPVGNRLLVSFDEAVKKKSSIRLVRF